MACARVNFQNCESNDIGIIRSERNLADNRRKPMSQAILHSVMNAGKVSFNVDQWIVRDESIDPGLHSKSSGFHFKVFEGLRKLGE